MSGIADFIVKVLGMMERYPEMIGWSQAGDELVVFDQRGFMERVLPEYFRHDKFESFVRQLNMYGFHKVCRHKNSINFRNENFERDNRKKLQNIKRRKREIADYRLEVNERQAEVKDILKYKYCVSHPNLPKLVESLFNAKNQAINDLVQLKKSLDELGKELNERKSKTVKPLITSVKQLINLVIEEGVEKIDNSTENFKKNFKMESAVSDPIIPYPILKPRMSQLKGEENKYSSEDRNKITGTLSITQHCSFHSVTKFITD